MALPIRGRVTLNTTVGEMEIELWSKETLKACKNFLALAMVGFVVPGSFVQTGDLTGIAIGGESFYGGMTL
ncbi:hypothetical protein CPC08DRAFT_630474 [Agrocybe pediades]|nr:hypothetical protein CPC08DRAFT_630474 [Agrocybe pediades]